MHWLLEECLRQSLLFVVFWFEADAQLAALSQDLAGEDAVILPASQNSNLPLFAPEQPVIYNWDPVRLVYRQLCLRADVLEHAANDLSFYGWNYNMFLCSLSFLATTTF